MTLRELVVKIGKNALPNEIAEDWMGAVDQMDNYYFIEI